MTSVLPQAVRDTATWSADRSRYVARGVSNMNRVIVQRALGALVWDVAGREYIDFAAGIGTMNVGHSHPEVVRAIVDQAERFTHPCFHVGMYGPYIDLARRLAEIAPGPTAKKVMFVNSGAEAVENAVKIARVATGRPGIIAFSGAFHGRTLLAMSLTGKEAGYKAQFGQMAPDIYRAPYPYPYRPPVGVPEARLTEHCIGALEDMLRTHVSPEKVAAVILEPIQGEAGFIVPPSDFLPALRSFCDRHGMLLIADEIQTGFGRTGRMFAVEHVGVEPDLIVVGKAVGAGIPLAGVIGSAEVMDAPLPGSLGGTYGGNPVACAAGLAVLDIMEREHLVERAQAIGTRLTARLRDMATRLPLIGDVRGLGAMVAIELVTDRGTKAPAAAETARIHDRCGERGVLLAKAGLHGNVIRFLAPLVASDEVIDRGLDIVETAIADERR